MPAYRTHSIHGEIVYPEIKSEIDIKLDDYKLYCMGPDVYINSDYETFERQHEEKVKDFFTKLLYFIKKNRLQENSEVMAYLYGQIDHFVLDAITHPLIYYITEDMNKEHKIAPHGLAEMWIDDYYNKKYNKDKLFYYHKIFIGDRKLIELINKIYKDVFNVNNMAFKHDYGALSIFMYDTPARRNMIGIVPLVIKVINTRNFIFKKNIDRVLPYLNLKHDVWYNPETGKQYTDSFDDLWDKASEITLETIDDVNNFLYHDKALTNPLIMNDTSYNTGIPCSQGQTLKYVRKY